MDERPPKPTPAQAAKAKREAALAKALRANLKRRKPPAAPDKKEND